MKRAAIYARYSSDLQRSESIDAQVRACKYYAQRFELDVVAVYADAAKSGRTTAKRDQFAVMMSAAASNQFDILLVHKLNRFSRSGTDTLNNKARLEQYGVELVSVTERLDNTPEGRLMLYVITGMNEFYSANLAAETMKGMRENAYQCKHTGGLPPLGYNVDPETKKLILNSEEAQAVKMIFSLYLSGCGYGEITQTLNAKGWKTKRGDLFGRNSIYEILHNEKYTGVYTFDKIESKTPGGTSNRRKIKKEYIRIEGGCPQIISKNDFEAVQRKMKANQHVPKGTAVENYLLSGKLYCGECGARLCGERHKVRDTHYSYYVCNEGKRLKSHHMAVPKDFIEDFVCETLSKQMHSYEAVKAISEVAIKSYEKDDKAVEKIEKEITECNTKIKNLIKAIASGLDEPELHDEIKNLKFRKSELETIKSTIAEGDKLNFDEWVIFLTHFCGINNLSDIDKRAILQTYVDKVFVFSVPDPDGKKTKHYDIEIDLNPNNVAGKAGKSLPLPTHPQQLLVYTNGLVVIKARS